MGHGSQESSGRTEAGNKTSFPHVTSKGQQALSCGCLAKGGSEEDSALTKVKFTAKEPAVLPFAHLWHVNNVTDEIHTKLAEDRATKL